MTVYRIIPRGSNSWWHLEKRVCLFFWAYVNSASNIEYLINTIQHLQGDIRIYHAKPNRIVESA